ncbi:MAG TPA: PepSY-associated TM helix domain-containing protein [Bacteroidales bacterium]|nr:PepSY-associated TM helix domain-containing protein [Bacteroidales bacterium]
MNWRKLNRILHRDLGYIFFGMTIIYSVSGVVLNHRSPSGDPSVVTTSFDISVEPATAEKIDKAYIARLLERVGEDNYKNYYSPSATSLIIYLDRGHISLDLNTGLGRYTSIRKRPVLTEFNFLHYNKPKRLWTLFSDIFAVSLGIIALTGLFILKGKNGIKRRGAILVSLGVTIPLVFLVLYLWTI